MPCPLHRGSEVDCLRFGAREAACGLCQLFYERGWLNAYGGGVSVREGNVIHLAPVGLASDGVCPVGVYVFEVEGSLREVRVKNFKFFERWELMLLPHRLLGAGAVIHSHSLNAAAASRVSGDAFRGRPAEGAGAAAEIPIVENSPDTGELAASLGKSLSSRPAAEAVLVRGHGAYVWGKDWMEAKKRAELYEKYFLDARIAGSR